MAKRTVIRGPLPVTKSITINELCSSYEPDRHKPTVEYQFSNGRQFKRVAGESYE